MPFDLSLHTYLCVLQFVRVSEMFCNSECWPQSSSVALCNAYRMRCWECQYYFHLSTRPPTEGERVRERAHTTQYTGFWDSMAPFPPRLEFSTIFSLHSAVWIFQAAKEQSYPGTGSQAPNGADCLALEADTGRIFEWEVKLLSVVGRWETIHVRLPVGWG